MNLYFSSSSSTKSYVPLTDETTMSAVEQRPSKLANNSQHCHYVKVLASVCCSCASLLTVVSQAQDHSYNLRLVVAKNGDEKLQRRIVNGKPSINVYIMSDESLLPTKGELRESREKVDSNPGRFMRGDRRPYDTNTVHLQHLP